MVIRDKGLFHLFKRKSITIEQTSEFRISEGIDMSKKKQPRKIYGKSTHYWWEEMKLLIR